MRKSVFRAPTLVTLALWMPACASSKPATQPEEERVVVEMPEEETEAGGHEGDDEGPADDGSPIGVPSCDRFIAKYLECSEEMPESARPAVLSGLKQVRTAWRQRTDSDTTELDEQCVAATRAAKEAMSPICPKTVWD